MADSWRTTLTPLVDSDWTTLSPPPSPVDNLELMTHLADNVGTNVVLNCPRRIDNELVCVIKTYIIAHRVFPVAHTQRPISGGGVFWGIAYELIYV